ncbi:MAG TPA: MOSC domain-containing protein [Devosiaceae bacterium]
MTVEIVPARKLTGAVEGVFVADGDGFRTRATQSLQLGFEGIAGDNHSGVTRRSGGREPWYPRGTEMRNERQVTILAPDELREVAAALDLAGIRPEWIGGNLLISGIPHLSLLPPRTQLFFEGGATLRVDGANGPCKVAGRSIASEFPGREDVELGFVPAAKYRRGLVAWVEKPGVVHPGEKVTARIWEQWIYPGS